MDALPLLHAAVTWFLAGLIWFVQVVHYPLFGRVGREGYAVYQREHERRTSLVVVAPMLVELATAILLAVRPPAVPQAELVTRAGLGLLAVVWASTFLLQVPEHRRLEGGFDAAAHRQLVTTNWVRTAAWTARAVLAALLLP